MKLIINVCAKEKYRKRELDFWTKQIRLYKEEKTPEGETRLPRDYVTRDDVIYAHESMPRFIRFAIAELFEIQKDKRQKLLKKTISVLKEQVQILNQQMLLYNKKMPCEVEATLLKLTESSFCKIGYVLKGIMTLSPKTWV